MICRRKIEEEKIGKEKKRVREKTVEESEKEI